MINNVGRFVMAVSLTTAVLMLVGKLTAYAITHSAALLSDAAESVVHVVATAFTAYSLWYASRPPDAEHPYGHGRIAYFSAGFEGALVIAASVAVIWSGVHGLLFDVHLTRIGTGLAISAGLAAINFILGRSLVRIGRKQKSLILISNGKHVLTDVWTTLAALVGLGLVKLTGVTWLDPLAAVLIGLLIMLSGFSLVRTSVAGLMDQIDPSVTSRLVAILQQQVDQSTIAEFDQLRCRWANDELWVDVVLRVPGDVSTREAHQRATRIEKLIEQAFSDESVHTTSHVEPAGEAVHS